MPDHSTDAPERADLPVEHVPAPSRTRAERRAAGDDYVHVARTDWREGGRTVRRWRERVLAVAFLSVGVGVLGAAALETFVDAAWVSLAASVIVLVSMLVPVAWAFSRSRPAGLLRFRPVDLLYAVVLGGLLRVAAGWIDVALGDSGAFPSYATVDGSLGGAWMLSSVVLPVGVAPMIEEFFFRAVLLVSVYTVLRRPVGRVTAGVGAVVVSAAVFVLMHALSGELGAGGVVGVGLLGLVCAALVMLTGRIWGAVLVHIVFNASYVVLALVGTFLA